MEDIKTLKKWKSFDFGPETKTVNECAENFNLNNHESSKFGANLIGNSENAHKKKIFNFVEKLAPNTISDLAVHPKKIQELEDWLTNKVVNQRQTNKSPNILLLSGPSGSAKSTALKVICKSLGILISEWINPIDQDYEYTRDNQVTMFLDFIIGSKWNSLFENDTESITLVKDFPNALIRQPKQFIEVLEEIHYKTNKPIVFICTESTSGNLNLVKNLFPDELITKFNIRHISFNVCAPTLLKNALKRAQILAKQNPDIFSQPSTSAVEAIIATSMGDIRNAVNQFYIIGIIDGGELPIITSKIESTGTKRKRKIPEMKIKGMERDENLGLFHGLGRILNPKWREQGTLKRLNCDIDKLVNEFSTQPGQFTSFLFENYIKYFGNFHDVTKAAEILSISVKFLDNSWDRHDVLYFALWISILGLMVFNKHKVSKWNQIRGPVKITNQVKRNFQLAGFDSSDIFYYNLITNTGLC